MIIKEDEKKDSTNTEGEGDEEEVTVGPKSNISLLDQHSRLKQEAEGKTKTSLTRSKNYLDRNLVCYLDHDPEDVPVNT